MKLSAQWIRDFVDAPVDQQGLADDLTAIGIAVEGISGQGADTVFEMEIGTNRPDAMNHYGVAREAAALYGVALKPIETAEAKTLPGSLHFLIISRWKTCLKPYSISSTKARGTSKKSTSAITAC